MASPLRHYPDLGLVAAKPKKGPIALAGQQRPLPNVEIAGAQFFSWLRPPHFDEATSSIVGAETSPLTEALRRPLGILA
jgi:hypothetical protein